MYGMVVKSLGFKGSLEDQIREGGHLLILLLVFLPDFFLDFFKVVFYFLPVMVKGSLEDQISDSIIVRGDIW